MPFIYDVPGIGSVEFENEDQAVAFMKQNPTPDLSEPTQDFGDLGGNKVSIPPEIDWYLKQAERYNPTDKNQAKIRNNLLNEYKIRRDDYLKKNPAPQPKEEKKPNLADEADVKKIINDLLAANKAVGNLGDIETAKKGVNTGPIAGDVYDASVPRFDETGNQIPPGFLDKIIASVAPKQTQGMRRLEAALQNYADYAFEKGGKNLTGTEKTSLFGRVPSRFDDDKAFGQILNSARENLGNTVADKVKTLKALGFDESAILKLIEQEAITTPGSDVSFLKSKIQPQEQEEVIDLSAFKR